MKTLSIGKLVYDINMLMDNYPTEGTKNVTKELISCSGGSANVVAYSLGKWNMESYISGVVGYDDTGNTMKKNMEENKVKTNYIEINYDIKTPVSYIIMNKENKVKTTIKTELNEYNIKKYEYDLPMDLVISDGTEYNASATGFNKYRNNITLLNAKEANKDVIEFFKYAKYVVCDSSVAEYLTKIKLDFNNPSSLGEVYKKILEKHSNINLIITMEEGTIYSVNNEIKILANMNSEIIDDSGIKDIFVAMVGFGLIHSYDLETIIRLATIASDLSKKTIGATLSIPELTEIISIYESKFGKIVNPNEILLEENNNA